MPFPTHSCLGHLAQHHSLICVANTIVMPFKILMSLEKRETYIPNLRRIKNLTTVTIPIPKRRNVQRNAERFGEGIDAIAPSEHNWVSRRNQSDPQQENLGIWTDYLTTFKHLPTIDNRESYRNSNISPISRRDTWEDVCTFQYAGKAVRGRAFPRYDYRPAECGLPPSPSISFCLQLPCLWAD